MLRPMEQVQDVSYGSNISYRAPACSKPKLNTSKVLNGRARTSKLSHRDSPPTSGSGRRTQSSSPTPKRKGGKKGVEQDGLISVEEMRAKAREKAAQSEKQDPKTTADVSGLGRVVLRVWESISSKYNVEQTRATDLFRDWDKDGNGKVRA